MEIKELLVLHHTHMDIGYTNPQRVVWELHRRTIDAAMDLCEHTANYPEGSRVKWTCEVTNVVSHWLDHASPAQIKRMRKLVKNGQFGFGAMLAHWTALHHEDMLIESLQPMKRLRGELGVDFKVAMQADVNGVAWPVTDMLLDAGVKHLMMNINIHMGGYPLSRPTIFRWQSPSGREVTVFSGEHYNAFTRVAGLRSPDVTVEQMAQGLDSYWKRLEKTGWNHDFAILTATHPVMDDNGPPNPELPEAIRRWNESGRAPFIRIVTLNELAEKLDSLDTKKIPVHGGDWTDFWTNGVAASALDVVMSRRAHGALWTARALSTRLPRHHVNEGAIRNATGLMHLANEHTWNVFASTAALGVAQSGRLEPIPEAEQRIDKSEKCAGALTLARMLRRDALDSLAGNPLQSRTQDGILLFNPSQIARKVCLRVPTQLPGGTYPMIDGLKHRIDINDDLLPGTNGVAWIGPVELPPLTLTIASLAGLPKKPDIDAGLRKSVNFVESRFWRLRFNPDTGAIKSLVHLESGNECFDKTLEWDLFGPVHEKVASQSRESRKLRDPRYDLFRVSELNFDAVVHADMDVWAKDWKAKRTRPKKTVRIDATIDAEGVHFHRWLKMPGVNGAMHQIISLSAHEPRVRFTAYFNKSDDCNPESLYFTFPVRMENAQAHFDAAGQAIAYDKEQLPGACRDWLTAGSFVAVEGKSKRNKQIGCVTLACPDAPLFHVGGFNYALHQSDVSHADHSLVIAWPTNNYWNTNFRASQPGHIRIEYEMQWSPGYDPASSAKFAASVARPVLYHPVVTMNGNAGELPLMEGMHKNVTIVTLKPDGDNAVILGLRNHAKKPVAMTPAFPGRGITTISRLNTLEENQEVLPITSPIELLPRRTTLFRIAFATANA